jgi:hypothetical protein
LAAVIVAAPFVTVIVAPDPADALGLGEEQATVANASEAIAMVIALRRSTKENRFTRGCPFDDGTDASESIPMIGTPPRGVERAYSTAR